MTLASADYDASDSAVEGEPTISWLRTRIVIKAFHFNITGSSIATGQLHFSRVDLESFGRIVFTPKVERAAGTRSELLRAIHIWHQEGAH